ELRGYAGRQSRLGLLSTNGLPELRCPYYGDACPRDAWRDRRASNVRRSRSSGRWPSVPARRSVPRLAQQRLCGFPAQARARQLHPLERAPARVRDQRDAVTGFDPVARLDDGPVQERCAILDRGGRGRAALEEPELEERDVEAHRRGPLRPPAQPAREGERE